MRRTTEQWEQLLDGTTEGLWEVESIPEMRYYDGETWETPGHHVVYGERGPLFATGEQTVEDAEQYQDNEANICLAAHAPAAVAEVIRLRKNLESLKTFVDNFPLVPPLVGMGSIEDRAKEMQAASSSAIARILEGEEK